MVCIFSTIIELNNIFIELFSINVMMTQIQTQSVVYICMWNNEKTIYI
jgi:hypothetical protein